MKKSQLKEKDSYYYEEKDWYKNCPEDLPEIPEITVEIFSRLMTHAEILKEYNITPYKSYAEAAAAIITQIPTLTNNYKSRISYFEENSTLFRFHAWRFGGGQLRLYVGEVDRGYEYDAGGGACFSNGPSDTSGDSPLDSLNLASAIQLCKDNGLVVYKLM